MDPRDLVVPEPVTTALAAGIAGVAGSYAVTGGTTAFVAVPVNAVVVDLMPAPIVTFSILFLGTIGEAVGFAMATGLVVAALGLGAAASVRVSTAPWNAAAATGGVGWLLALGLAGDPWRALGAAVPAGLVVWGLQRADPVETVAASRRRFLKAVGGTVAFGVVAFVIGDRIAAPTTGGEAPLAEVLGDVNPEAAASVEADVEARLGEATAAGLDVDGLGGLVTETTEFYEVDKNWIDPDVDAEGWSMRVTGEVGTGFEVTYDDLLAMEPEHVFVTLRCVSDPLNGELIDTALWTGVPVERLLERAGPTGDQVVLRAADDYFEDFPLGAFEGGFLAYGMNGHALPRSHGYPVRGLVLGHWGEVNVKWLTELDVVTGEVLGYWEQRDWHGTGPVHPVAKVWAENRLGDGRAQVAGFAYGGIRGVSGVEVSTDGGETWAAARLSEPLEADDVWRQWAYEWRPDGGGSTEVVVRMIDGDGVVQPAERSRPNPSGASGWVHKTVSV